MTGHTPDETGGRPKHRKITATVSGQAQLDTFAAMCFLNRRRPHEMVNDALLGAIRAARNDPHIQELEANLRRSRRGLRLVSNGGPDD